MATSPSWRDYVLARNLRYVVRGAWCEQFEFRSCSAGLSCENMYFLPKYFKSGLEDNQCWYKIHDLSDKWGPAADVAACKWLLYSVCSFNSVARLNEKLGSRGDFYSKLATDF